MKRRNILFAAAAMIFLVCGLLMFWRARATAPEMPMPRFAIAIHGGAGTILRSDMTEEKEREYRKVLGQALEAGRAILASGGTSLDAVEAAVMLMEDSPLFNAGRGAVFTSAGTNELDAAIMDGATRSAGAVAGVTKVKNPIKLARAVMEKSPHVMLQGPGAEMFAQEQNIDIVDPSYFFTEARWEQLQRIKKAQEGPTLDHDGAHDGAHDGTHQGRAAHGDDHKHGTVGAVALDMHGNLAAATSTGGMTNKRWGRVGDTPVIGAGTYASNRSCAVSGTGHGEYFIRATVAREICALMEHKGMSLAAAAHAVVMEDLRGLGGDGGVIAVDRHGNVALVFNTKGMYRGHVRDGEDAVIAIYEQ